MDNKATLHAKALEAMKHSYSPYSNFPVGCCLIGVNGFSDDGRLIVANGNARAGRS